MLFYPILFFLSILNLSFCLRLGLTSPPPPDKGGPTSKNITISERTVAESYSKIFQSELMSVLPSVAFPKEFLKIEEDTLFHSVSDACTNHGKELIRQFRDNQDTPLKVETWALQMVDAWGKLPEGILSAHIAALGDYDECVGIRWQDKVDQIHRGRYCTHYLIPHENPLQSQAQQDEDEHLQEPNSIKSRNAGTPNDIMALLKQSLVTDYPLFPSIGSCFPSACSNEDANQLLNNIMALNLLNGTVYAITMNCETDETIFNYGDYAMIGVLSVLGIFIVIGTAIDVYRNTIHSFEGNNNYFNTGILLKIFISFSVYTNTRKWWNTENNSSSDLACLHGIKFISTTWVVMGHTFFMYVNQPVWNTLDLYKIYEKSTLLLLILNAGVVVDTFFAVGGFLVSYNILKTLDKTKGKLNIPLMYLSRYIRLTPSYAIILGFCTTLFYHLSSGPNWWVMRFFTDSCKKNWWKNLLYINAVVKYYPEEDPLDIPCHGESWYLSADMMFFLISPFLIYPLWRKQIVGIPLMVFVTTLSLVIPSVVTYTRNFKPVAIPFTDTHGGKFSRDAYMAPWMRGTPYAVGIWLGFLLYKTPRVFKIPKSFVIIGWLVATATALTVLLGIHHYFDPYYEIPKIEAAIYSGGHRLAWAVSISWVIFACAKGYGGLINKFLSWKGFIPLGRLGYCVFLVSLHVQLLFHLRYRQSIHYDFYSAINLYFAHIVTSYCVGFICSITLEAPFIQLEKLIFGNGSLTKNKKPDT